jgi:iron complex transport system substrate-binding protein
MAARVGTRGDRGTPCARRRGVRAALVPGRRAVLQAMALGFVGACTARVPHASMQRGGIVALDWALAETLVALGRPPSGVVAAADWRNFVVEPALPAGVADLGLQQDINLELLALLEPELILTSPFLAHLEPVLARIAPTLNLSVYALPERPLANRIHVTHVLAARTGVPHAGARLVEELHALRAAAEAALAATRRRPLAFASFIDPRHARVYGGSSLYADVLAWLGLDNAWAAPVGRFGFATIGVEELAALGDAELVVVEPTRPDIARELATSPLWKQLPPVRAGHEGSIEPVFMFGALPSARRLITLLIPHLRHRWLRS